MQREHFSWSVTAHVARALVALVDVSAREPQRSRA
jgi:hypothetical protein